MDTKSSNIVRDKKNTDRYCSDEPVKSEIYAENWIICLRK